MTDLNEQDRADFEAWAKGKNFDMDTHEGSYLSLLTETAREAWQAARRQHGSVVQAVAPAEPVDSRVREWMTTHGYGNQSIMGAMADLYKRSQIAPPVADAAQIKTHEQRLKETGYVNEERNCDLYRAEIAELRALSRSPAAAPEITPWLETDEGKAAIAKAVADVDASIAALDEARTVSTENMNASFVATPGGNGAAEQPAAEPDLEAALDAEYPMPESRHTSVIQRAMDARIAFKYGWRAHLRAAGQGSKDSERLDWLEEFHPLPASGQPSPAYGDVGLALFERTSDGWMLDKDLDPSCPQFDTLRAAIDAAKAKGEQQ